jgi:hypothetical protein
MPHITLTQDRCTIVDDEDFMALVTLGWHCVKMGTTRQPLFYAARNVRGEDGKSRLLLMHRMIMQAPPGMVVDHINHDGLDNRRSNLRLCTQRDNMQNIRRSDNKTGFRGVYKSSLNRWMATIHKDGRPKFLGTFPSPEQAAQAYDNAAREVHGQFAHTNFAQQGQEHGAS